MSPVRRTLALLPALLLASLVAAPGLSPAVADDPAPTVQPALVQSLKVSWAGAQYKGGAYGSTVVPGIGRLAVTCRRDETQIELTPYNRNAETQMWMAKYETKGGNPAVAVKTARVYRYATAADTAGSGTGPRTREGLNQQSRIENQSSGYLHGIISQRPSRRSAAGSAALPPSTSFRVYWSWNGFRRAPRNAACTITAVLTTNVTGYAGTASGVVRAARLKRVKFGKRVRTFGRVARVAALRTDDLALSWHGDTDAATASSRTAALAGLGDLTATCETGRDGRAELTLTPDSPNTWAYVETISGEGLVDDHVDTYSASVDPESGTLGPIDLPSNGMLRVYLSSAGRVSALIVSSYRITNDDDHPERNLCEVATAPWID